MLLVELSPCCVIDLHKAIKFYWDMDSLGRFSNLYIWMGTQDEADYHLLLDHRENLSETNPGWHKQTHLAIEIIVWVMANVDHDIHRLRKCEVEPSR